MEALTFSMVVLTCLWLTWFKSSAAVSRSFNSSIRRVLFSSMVCCSVLCGGFLGLVFLVRCSVVGFLELVFPGHRMILWYCWGVLGQLLVLLLAVKGVVSLLRLFHIF